MPTLCAYTAYKQCGVTERTLYDGSFDEVMLLPERLDDDVPNKSRVSLGTSPLTTAWYCFD